MISEDLTTISLSMDAIRETVYANTAVRVLMSPDEVRPSMLTRHRAPLLTKLIRSTSLEFVGRLAPAVQCTDPGETAGDTLELRVALRSGVEAAVVRRLIEEAIGALTLRGCYLAVSPAVAELYDRNARSLGESLMPMLRPSGRRLRLRPCII